MKILIMSITAGEGHNMTARALEAELSSRGVICDVLDAFGYVSSLYKQFINKGLLFTTRYTRIGYSMIYRILERRRPKKRKTSLMRELNDVIGKKLTEYIKITKPDAVIYTNVLIGAALDPHKERGEINVPLIGVLTDFAMHPCWEEATHSEYFIVPSEDFIFPAVKKGYRESQVKPYGIPVLDKFNSNESKAQARGRLGIDTEKTTVLVMAGSTGYGNIPRTVRRLDNIPLDFQMIVMCGKNERAFNTVRDMRTKKKIYAFAFTNKVNQIMDSADICVSKPGGISTSEAMIKGLPFVIHEPVPGHEERNTEYLTRRGAALASCKGYPVDKVVYELLLNQSKLKELSEHTEAIRRPCAAKDISDLAVKAAEERRELFLNKEKSATI